MFVILFLTVFVELDATFEPKGAVVASRFGAALSSPPRENEVVIFYLFILSTKYIISSVFCVLFCCFHVRLCSVIDVQCCLI